MSETELQKEIKSDENKVYAVILSQLSSLLTANMLLLGYVFFCNSEEYLTYHNSAENFEVPHDVDLTLTFVCGGIAVVLIIFVFLAVRGWFKRIKQLEHKTLITVMTILGFIVLLPVWGYITVLFFALFT